MKKIQSSDIQAGDEFGLRIEISDNKAIVAAEHDDSGGAAYIFYKDFVGVDNWGEVKKITASDASTMDEFGRVAISENIAVVTAIF